VISKSGKKDGTPIVHQCRSWTKTNVEECQDQG
jgi:hypothetical protein